MLFLLLLSPAADPHGREPWRYSQPQVLDDGWETADLESLDVDASRIHQLFNQLQGNDHRIHSILVVKDGRLIIDEYFGAYDTGKTHDLRSVTKSITSILMGIALDEGFIQSIDDPFMKYVQDPVPRKDRDGRKQDITLRHLMTMSSGLDCDDWDSKSRGQEDRVYRQRDWLQYFLDLPVVHDPGTVARYCTLGQVLATEAISRASGRQIDEFASQYLFGPLGIENLSWGHTSRRVPLVSAKRLHMTPRDMAKVGQLILDGGEWHGKQVVSEAWLRASTAPETSIGGMEYGLLWWNIPLTVNGTRFGLTAATGNGGQYIFIVPDLHMVAVFTGGAYNSKDDKLPFMIMQDIFIHAFGHTAAGTANP